MDSTNPAHALVIFETAVSFATLANIPQHTFNVTMCMGLRPLYIFERMLCLSSHEPKHEMVIVIVSKVFLETKKTSRKLSKKPNEILAKAQKG